MEPATVILIAVLICLNSAAFILMAHDKQCARKNRRRVPEKILFLSAILFGAFGGTMSMFIFRHKTRHWYFRVFFPLLMIIQAAVTGYAWVRWL